MTRESLLGIFHRGVQEKHRRTLDTASNGCFASLDTIQGEQLIENLAQSDACYDEDYEPAPRDTSTDKRLNELNEKLDKISKVFLMNQRPVHSIEDEPHQPYQEIGSDGTQEEVNYLGNQGGFQRGTFNQNYRSHPNFSYRSTNVENPQDQVYPPQQAQGSTYQQNRFGGTQQNQLRSNEGFGRQAFQPSAQQGYQPQNNNYQPRNNNYQPRNNNYQPQNNTYQPKQAPNPGENTSDIDVKNMIQQVLDRLAEQSRRNDEMQKEHAETHAKIDNLSSRLKDHDNQLAQIASTSKRPMGGFPGKAEANPKEYCKAITLRGGKQIPPRMEEDDHEEKGEEKEILVEAMEPALTFKKNEKGRIEQQR